MSVPTSVQSLLSKQNVHYQVSEVPFDENERALWHDQHLRTMSAAKSVILQDTKGRVQVIFAADRLLDLKAVNRQLGRELHAAKPEDIHKFCLSHNLQSIPALPKLAGLLTLVDRSTGRAKSVVVDDLKVSTLLPIFVQPLVAAIDGVCAGAGAILAMVGAGNSCRLRMSCDNCTASALFSAKLIPAMLRIQ